MKTVKTFPCVSVDTGGICVADLEWFRRQGAKDAGADIELPKGVYDVTIEVHKSWLGRVCARGRMNLNGPVYVGDPGYGGFSDEKWDRLLKRTLYFEKMPGAAAAKLLYVGTGGDGGMKTTVTLRQAGPDKPGISKPGKEPGKKTD